MKGVVYQGCRLMPGSRALQLLEEGKHKELAAHMKEVDQRYVQQTGTPQEVADRITAFRERTGIYPWPEPV